MMRRSKLAREESETTFLTVGAGTPLKTAMSVSTHRKLPFPLKLTQLAVPHTLRDREEFRLVLYSMSASKNDATCSTLYPMPKL